MIVSRSAIETVVTGKGAKRRLIPILTELVATVDEYLLTEYPLLGRVPVQTDFLWYGVYKVGGQAGWSEAGTETVLSRLPRLVVSDRGRRWGCVIGSRT